jgi:hypothetical protein
MLDKCMLSNVKNVDNGFPVLTPVALKSAID